MYSISTKAYATSSFVSTRVELSSSSVIIDTVWPAFYVLTTIGLDFVLRTQLHHERPRLLHGRANNVPPQVRRVYILATRSLYADATQLWTRAILYRPDLPHTLASLAYLHADVPVFAHLVFLFRGAATSSQSLVVWYQGSLIYALVLCSRPRTSRIWCETSHG